MNYKAILFYLLALLPVLLSTSKPDDDPTVLGPLYMGEAADYIYFEEGTWWKYVNTKTNEIDSTILVASSKKMQTYGCSENNNSIQKENVTFETQSLTTCNHRYYKLEQPWGCYPLLSRYFEFLAQNTCIISGASVTFYHPFDLPASGNSGQKTTFNQLHDSLLIQNRWYYDVAEFEVDIDYTLNGRRGFYYWAKNIGLIKREKYSHITGELEEGWELIGYYIVK